jgi:hypothetical protein
MDVTIPPTLIFVQLYVSKTFGEGNACLLFGPPQDLGRKRLSVLNQCVFHAFLK